MSDTQKLAVTNDSNVGIATSQEAYQQYKKLLVKETEENSSPDLSDWKVGSAGLYWEPDDEETTAKLVDKEGNESKISTTIELGLMKKGNNITMSVEQGIADYVKELALDDMNHLPSSKVGVMIHYLSEGIARDFQTTWSAAPASLGGGRGRGGSKADREAGKRGMSKKEKNQLFAKLDMNNYMDDIQNGSMTYEEAFAEIKSAVDKKVELEGLGYYLSPNKTEGVLLYDWKSIVNETYKAKDDVEGCKLYMKRKLEVVLPNVFDTYFADNYNGSNKRLTTELSKSPLLKFVVEQMAKYGVKGLGTSGFGDETGGFKQDDNIDSTTDILKAVGHKSKGDVIGVHLVKFKTPGLMKPRWVCVDVFENGMQKLYLYGQEGETMTIVN